MKKSKMVVGATTIVGLMMGVLGSSPVFAEGASGGDGGVGSGVGASVGSGEIGDDLVIEINEINMNGGLEISQINEGKNTITVMYTGTSSVERPEYIISKYHFFWGDVEDGELASKLTDKTGVMTIAMGDDGESVFYRSHMQVDFTPENGIRIRDNLSKIISYVVEVKPLKAGLPTKIIAGRYDYSSCVNTYGYTLDGSIFCGRDEWVTGKSFYHAYNRDWRKLEPLLETTGDGMGQSEGEVILLDDNKEDSRESGALGRNSGQEVKIVLLGGGDALNGRRNTIVKRASIRRGQAGGGVMVQGDEIAGSGDVLRRGEIADVKDKERDDLVGEDESSTQEIEVPILGGKNKFGSGWWLGFCAILSIGALGMFSYFFLPVAVSRRRRDRNKQSGKKHK